MMCLQDLNPLFTSRAIVQVEKIGVRSSVTAPGVTLGLRSRLASTDYFLVIVPPTSM
jgi:hypothetical protein